MLKIELSLPKLMFGNNFDGDVFTSRYLLGLVDGPHPALAEFLDDLVLAEHRRHAVYSFPSNAAKRFLTSSMPIAVGY